ncbi:rhodanese-like domain-containing protein [Tomitella biformata]|uniref:rhodanese-like domain-containing protein n=1 Tax=Tomitella biformata TaxID=630403 RepID=UPI000466D016|nr:rhodanese-like domain-containing protein [Tomitella biformata]
MAATDLSAAVLRGAVVVDIRPQSARAVEGTLPGALAIEPALLADRLDSSAPTRLALAVDQDVEWVLVSSDGSVSARVATALQQLGLRNVVDVAGGYRALRAEGGVGAVSSAQHLRREARSISAH